MGLDVYVGTLTRYLTGDWETIAEQTARELGLPFQTVRAEPEPEDAIRDPDVVRDAVLRWREALSEVTGVALAWSEADPRPYFTDKPDWDGYWGLLLLAAHDERPQIPLPEEMPESPSDHPLLEGLTTPPRRRLFRRSRPDTEPPRYWMLYVPELWLPVEVDGIWGAPFVTGDQIAIGSTRALLAQLRRLVEQLGMTEADLTHAREEGGIGEVLETFELEGQTVEVRERAQLAEAGQHGLAVFLELAKAAVEHSLPLKLDY